MIPTPASAPSPFPWHTFSVTPHVMPLAWTREQHLCIYRISIMPDLETSSGVNTIYSNGTCISHELPFLFNRLAKLEFLLFFFTCKVRIKGTSISIYINMLLPSEWKLPCLRLSRYTHSELTVAILHICDKNVHTSECFMISTSGESHVCLPASASVIGWTCGTWLLEIKDDITGASTADLPGNDPAGRPSAVCFKGIWMKKSGHFI